MVPYIVQILAPIRILLPVRGAQAPTVINLTGRSCRYWSGAQPIFSPNKLDFGKTKNLSGFDTDWLSPVSVLEEEEVYTAKYSLSPREFTRAQPGGTPEGSGHILLYIPRRVLINTDVTPFLKVTLWPFSVLSSRCGVILEKFILPLWESNITSNTP